MNLNRIKLLFFALILGLFASCNTNPGKEKTIENQLNFNDSAITQTTADLISGSVRAICYSGFREGQHPDRGKGAVNPTNDEILEDLSILIKNEFNLIRIYDCGENSEMVLKLIRENALPVKVMQGIWLKAELSNHLTCEWLTEPIPEDELLRNRQWNREEINRGIRLANEYPEIIVAVNVGNEALVEWNDHRVDTDTVISYVSKVKRQIVQPVTVAENYKWWAEQGAKLASEVDFLAIHIYPVWEGKDIDEGMDFSIDNIQEVHQALPGSTIVISEAGWPSIASEFGERASEEKQERYFRELMDYAAQKHITVFWFEAFDESWKGDPGNALGAEKHWGIFNIDRTPKKVMKMPDQSVF